MSLMCIDLYETDGLLLFSSKSIIFQTTDLERVIEKAENIFNFYLDFNWELRFVERNLRISHEISIKLRQKMRCCRSLFLPINPNLQVLLQE